MIAAEVAPETAPDSVRIWLAIIGIITPFAAVVLAYLSNRGKSKAGMNADPPENETGPEPPRPPIVKADGEVDAVASVMQLVDDVHRLRQRSDAENQRLKQQLFEMKTELGWVKRHHRTATQQLLTWAVNLSGSPPHPVPDWVSELVESARQA